MTNAAGHGVAWGVATGGAEALRVRLVPHEGGWRAESAGRPAGDEPLGATVPDEALLYRRLDLPPAEDDALGAMAAAQMELHLPGAEEDRAVAAARLPDGAVLAAGTRRGAVERAADGAKVVVPEAAAVGAAWAAFFGGDGGRRVLVHVAARATGVLLVGASGLEHAAVVPEGAEDWADPEADHAAWARDVAGAARLVTEHLPEAERPTGCVLLGEGDLSEARRACEHGGGLTVDPLPPARGLTLAEGVEPAASLAAVGAALYAASAAKPRLVLGGGERQAEAAPVRRVPVKLIGAGVVALACLLALYALDVYEASRVQAEPTAEAREERARIRQAIALGRYLLDQPPPVLVAVDALSSAASDRTTVKHLEYDGQGRIRFGGEVNGVGEVDKTLTNLTRATPLEKPEMRSASVERDKWTFDVEAQLVSLHRHIALDAQRHAEEARRAREAAASASAGDPEQEGGRS